MTFVNSTKHEQVIRHIESLAVGDKVSVRQLAREMGISEGTVYRAIKEAENLGLVSSIPKVGTIRIEPSVERSLDTLSYDELVSVLEGRFLSGKMQGQETPKAYFVATGEEKIRSKNLGKETLIIAEYDRGLLSYVLEHRLPLLLCGHEKVTDYDLSRANLNNVLLISTPHEIFETISLINQIIFERVENRDLLRIEAIMTQEVWTLDISDRVSDWHALFKRTGFSRFPVVDSEGVLYGLVTARDITDTTPSIPISDVMIKKPITVKKDDLVSYLARLLVWESVELVPVIEGEKLIGVVSRQDIIEALQSLQKQPQFGETYDNTVMSGFSLLSTKPNVIIGGQTKEFMTNEYGEVSISNLSTIASNMAKIAMRISYDEIVEVRQINLSNLKSIGMNVDLSVKATSYIHRKNEYLMLIEFLVLDEVVAIATVMVSSREK